VCQLYLSIAVPRMLYGADIFLTPHNWVSPNKTDTKKGGRAIINKLAAIQQCAAIMITSAMRTTPTDTLDALANLLPIHMLVDKHCHRAGLRLATLPKCHPLYTPVIMAAKHPNITHASPLHRLMDMYKIQPERMEKIDSARQSNKWTSPFTITIAETREEAIEEDEKDRRNVKVYTDGSGIGGKIGVAAVLYRAGRILSTMRYWLGSAKRHTVYEGECIGALMGLKLIEREENVRAMTFGIDNHTAITSTSSI
jgi:hypothetical protein